MPHSRSPVKSSGDVHPPEVEDDFGPDPTERATAASAAPLAEGASSPRASPAPQTRAIVVSMPARQYVDVAREQVRARPLTTAAAAFFAGFVIAVVTRSR